MSARSWIGWIALTLAIAVAVHLGSVWYLPHYVMNRALAQMGAPNTIHHGTRATAEKHGVVRPSPDLLYSVCPFDLRDGPLLIGAPVPVGTYWSVSLFDDRTNNFFVENDSAVKGTFEIVIVHGDGPAEKELLSFPGGELKGSNGRVIKILRAPSERGLAVFRTLVSDESKLPAIEAVRRKAFCVRPRVPNGPYPY
ncbi:MAG TPA: DUF1254 domain-containing protein [Rhizomicrobium sp.]|jgi:uncharacterized membrane protein